MPPDVPADAVSAVAPADADKANATILLAFSADPMTRWTLPDAARYLAVFPRLAHAFGSKAFGLGTAYQVDDYSGAALWLPPGTGPDEEALVSIFREAAPPEVQADGFGVFEQMAAYHPKEPHWYLPLIGVDPARQGRGLGSALLAHALRRCDEDRAPAYLESSNPTNIPLYERHGFRVLGEIRVGSSPVLTPMLRPAR